MKKPIERPNILNYVNEDMECNGGFEGYMKALETCIDEYEGKGYRDENGTLLSCCGDILDENRMICPTCKEHC